MATNIEKLLKFKDKAMSTGLQNVQVTSSFFPLWNNIIIKLNNSKF